MTYEKAIEALKPIIEPEIYEDYFIDACKLAIKAMELQVAKKLTAIDERIGESYYYLAFVCPTCDETVIGQPYRPNYCKHCGQKLDWSEE